MKLALHILGKCPCISSMFGDEVHFFEVENSFCKNEKGNIDQKKTKQKQKQQRLKSLKTSLIFKKKMKTKKNH